MASDSWHGLPAQTAQPGALSGRRKGAFSSCNEDAVVMKQAKPASRVSAVETVFAQGDA